MTAGTTSRAMVLSRSQSPRNPGQAAKLFHVSFRNVNDNLITAQVRCPTLMTADTRFSPPPHVRWFYLVDITKVIGRQHVCFMRALWVTYKWQFNDSPGTAQVRCPTLMTGGRRFSSPHVQWFYLAPKVQEILYRQQKCFMRAFRKINDNLITAQVRCPTLMTAGTGFSSSSRAMVLSRCQSPRNPWQAAKLFHVSL